MFERGVYLSLFHCLCYFKEMATNFSKEHVSEERYPDLTEEEDIIMNEIRENHWRDVSEECDNKKKIHALIRGVYVKEE